MWLSVCIRFRGEEVLDQFRFLGNCPPTSVNVGLGEG